MFTCRCTFRYMNEELVECVVANIECRISTELGQTLGKNASYMLLWFVSWELDCASCFSKIPKYDKPLLRRIFRRGTNNNTISKT